MARCARERQVFFVEEPIWVDDGAGAGLDLSRSPEGVVIVVPQLPPFLARDLDAVERTIASLVSAFLSEQGITRPVFWYWTPMALAWTTAIEASAVIYDCMDELSLFVGAPPQLLPREAELLFRADLVFTGGRSLFEAKSPRHSSVHLFPSSIEATHFGRARCLAEATEPADQAEIPHPRLGFFGVIDERFDVDLVAGLAVARPDWHLVLIGPVVKIDPQSLPKAKNLHFLGGKGYGELPAYLAGWDVALLPFAANDSTRFISPTKTPEYLAGGRRVVSTPINDVIEPYGRLGLVEIAQGIEDFAAAVERCLGATDSQSWLDRVDAHLAQMSWDETWRLMSNEIDAVMETKRRPARSGARSSPSVFR
ncbi:MAG TPA: glycosyltransferase [Thermoanaerobaculia bacterium]|jgi:UDP-galactopyranose mutase|nr:glycosyltransferase [Thermoanaerobaculia bacterium]